MALTAQQIGFSPQREATKKFEGYRKRRYTDTTGHPTIGYGFMLDDPMVGELVGRDVASGEAPLSRDTADRIFEPLYQRARTTAVEFVGQDTWGNLNETQQGILTDMAYNLGSKLGGFENMRQAIQNKDPQGVRREMKDSKWYSQVGRRSKSHVKNWESLGFTPEGEKSKIAVKGPVGSISSFGDAFKEARRQGKAKFYYKGDAKHKPGWYTTKLK